MEEYNEILNAVRAEGFAEGNTQGEAQGYIEGLTDGRIEGRAKGRLSERYAIRRRLINELGMSLDEANCFVNPGLEDILR